MKPAAFELGGSDAFIVREDIEDMSSVVKNAIKGRMKANAQSCNNSKRFIIHESLYDKFKEELILQLQRDEVIGDPLEENTTLGPLSSSKQRQILMKQIADSVQAGAIIAFGDLNYLIQDSKLKNGYYFGQVVLENIPKDCAANKEELFGPVFCLYSFKTDLEAIKIANSSEFGLSGSIFTSNEEKGKEIARMLECGTVFINAVVGSDPQVPNGGVKDSGYGRECGKDGVMESVNRKPIVISK